MAAAVPCGASVYWLCVAPYRNSRSTIPRLVLKSCYGATRPYAPLVPPSLSRPSAVPATSLRARYAMSGTEIAYAAIGLRDRYAMPGTELAYGAMRLCDTEY
eukprot:3217177-Rhodomonas_salina.1